MSSEPKTAMYPARPMLATGMPRNTDHLDFCTSSQPPETAQMGLIPA